jgi:acetylornithine deacetylase/succinyl-diaminopimelate desuccinylase-like protein
LGLDTVIHQTNGNPIVVAKTPLHDSAKPTFLVYGHYDVQPPEPFDLWKTPPFEPRIEGRNAYARGISDNKGQHLAHLNAVEAYLKTGTTLPCNLTFLIEGEEEVGSTELYEFLPAHKKDLACAAVVISDNGIPSLETPALTYSLRGIAALEIRLDGPSRDLHSGLFGGSVENPAMALCQLLAKLRDAKGRTAYDVAVEHDHSTDLLELLEPPRPPLTMKHIRALDARLAEVIDGRIGLLVLRLRGRVAQEGRECGHVGSRQQQPIETIREPQRAKGWLVDARFSDEVANGFETTLA